MLSIMVKKIFVFILALLSISPATYAKDLVVRKKAGGYLIEARIDRNPPILNYKTNSKLKGEKYQATMNFIMSGPWIIRILIKSKGKRMTVKFNIDVQ